MSHNAASADARAKKITWCVWLFALLHLLIPLRYYAARGYDERFAWRMFSQVRVQTCTLEAEQTLADGTLASVPLERTLPAPWIALLRRNRQTVITRFLDWQCQHSEAREVMVTTRCVDADGAAVPSVPQQRLCAPGSPSH